MRVELSEVLVCPGCGPDANLVLMVDRREEGRVRAGTLACARCDARYPVRRGVVRFGKGPGPETDWSTSSAPSLPGPPEGPDPGELATEVAALLELHRRGGVVLLGPGLGPAARRVAGLAERAEVVLVAGPREAGGRGGGTERETRGEEAGGEGGGVPLTVAAGVAAGELPVRAHRLAGVALWRPEPELVRRGAGALAPGGRLVVLRPSGEARDAAAAAGLELAASEERAFVADRPA